MFSRVTKFFAGRHTLFLIWFALTGLILSLMGKLTGSYVGLCSALQGAALLHSTKEDFYKNQRDDNGNPKT